MLKPLLELSKTFITPIGGKIVDKMISDSLIAVSAFENNDMVLAHKLLNENKKSLESVASHITQPQLQEFATEYIASYNSVATCIIEGKCGYQSIIHFMFNIASPMKKIIMTLAN